MRRIDLQTIRDEHKITQKQLSELTGFPQGFISKMERGVVSTSETFIAKVADVLRIPNIEKYVYDDTASNINSFNNVNGIAGSNISNVSSDQVTIQRLFDILDKRDARIEKLEQEIDVLRRENAELKAAASK